MEFIVSCKDVSKNFKNVEALKKVSFHIEENKIYGLLGRNGAGKTTLLNILSTNVIRKSGEVRIFGEEPFENQKVLSNLCFINDTLPFLGFKVSEIFKISSMYYKNWDEKFKNDLVKKFDINNKKRYITLSKGTKAIIGIIVGLASRAPLTIFDEAYSGLDAAARKIFYDTLREDHTENPRTIIFSTHLIDEAAALFDNVIIINEGNVLLSEETETITENFFEIVGNSEVYERMKKDKKVLGVEDFGRLKKFRIFSSLSNEEIKELNSLGGEFKKGSLQELFIHLTAK